MVLKRKMNHVSLDPHPQEKGSGFDDALESVGKSVLFVELEDVEDRLGS
jgi:hypothetical protein